MQKYSVISGALLGVYEMTPGPGCVPAAGPTDNGFVFVEWKHHMCTQHHEHDLELSDDDVGFEDI